MNYVGNVSIKHKYGKTVYPKNNMSLLKQGLPSQLLESINRDIEQVIVINT